MNTANPSRWIGVIALLSLLCACGGGGGGSAGSAAGIAAPVSGQPGASGTVMSKNGADAEASVAPVMTAQLSTGARADFAAAATRLRQGDARNGSYTVFAANGTRQSLSINFDTRSYEITDTAGQGSSGRFVPDPAYPDTYVFVSRYATDAGSVARFRATPEMIVGAFPFAEVVGQPTIRQTRPFVGVRTLVTDQNRLDGTYNRFGLALVYAGSGSVSYSYLHQLRIQGNGSSMDICRYDKRAYTLEDCPAGYRKTYTLSRGSMPGLWRASGSDAAAEQLEFSIARVAGQNLYLAAGAVPPAHTAYSQEVQLRIGLPGNSEWRQGTWEGPRWMRPTSGTSIAPGVATWASSVFDANELRSTGFGGEGIWSESVEPLPSPAPAAYQMPTGVRLRIGSAAWVVGQGAGLMVEVTIPMDTKPYPYDNGSMTIAMAGSSPVADPRNGTYQVFAANGTRHTLKLDFDARKFAFTAEDGAIDAGDFAPDPSEQGTYLFLGPRITGAVNTARFQPMVDGIVGGFPLRDAGGIGASLTQPFVAARAFVTDASSLDGVYNGLGITRSAAGTSNSIGNAMRIDGLGTRLAICNSAVVYSIESCPASSMTSYAISRAAGEGRWSIANPANPADRDELSVVRLNGKNVILQTAASAGSAASMFRVGLPSAPDFETDLPFGMADDPFFGFAPLVFGADTAGAWVRGIFLTEQYKSTLNRPDASTGELAFSLYKPGPGGTTPVGIRNGITPASASDHYAAIQNAGLGVLLGWPNNLRTQGYMQLVLANRSLLEPLRMDVYIDGIRASTNGSGAYPVSTGSHVEFRASTDIYWILGIGSSCATPADECVRTDRSFSYRVPASANAGVYPGVWAVKKSSRAQYVAYLQRRP